MTEFDTREKKTSLVHFPGDILVVHNVTSEDIANLEKVAGIAVTSITSRRGK